MNPVSKINLRIFHDFFHDLLQDECNDTFKFSSRHQRIPKSQNVSKSSELVDPNEIGCKGQKAQWRVLTTATAFTKLATKKTVFREFHHGQFTRSKNPQITKCQQKVQNWWMHRANKNGA